MNNTDVGKNIWYLTTYLVMTSVFTYIFWFFTAKMAGPQAVGTASYLASLTLIFATVELLDMSLGMKRPMGLAISRRDFGRFKQILTCTLLLASVIVAITVIFFEVPSFNLFQLLKIDKEYQAIFIGLIIATPFQFIFTEALIAALRVKDLRMPLILGSIVRFPVLAVAIYLFKAPIIGTVIAYSSLTFIITFFYAFYSIRIFRKSTKGHTKNDFLPISKQVLMAGLASWFPHLIYVLGAQLGIVTVVVSSGQSEGGKFYLAMGIFLVMLFIVLGISRVIHSSISSISDEKAQADLLTYYMKIAFMFSMPLAVPLLFYANDFMSFMGQEYSTASSALTIFMIGFPMSIISEMVYYFVYGKGDHKTVLFLGLAGNIPRIALYFVLPVFLGINGAAIAYLVGSASQLVLSIFIRRYHLLVMEFKKYLLLSAVPVLIGFGTWIGHLNFVPSTIVIIIVSILIFIKLHLFTDDELRTIVYMILPLHKADNVYPKLSQIMRRIS